MRKLIVLFVLLTGLAAGAQAQTCISECVQTMYESYFSQASGKWKSIEELRCEYHLNPACQGCQGPCQEGYNVTIRNTYQEIDEVQSTESSCVYINGQYESETSFGNCPNKPEPAPAEQRTWGVIKQLYRE